MYSYFTLLNLSFVENYHISIFTIFAKQSMINRYIVGGETKLSMTPLKQPKVTEGDLEVMVSIDSLYLVKLS